MPFLHTSHGKLFYAQRGTGTPAVVAVHGAGGTHQHWGLQLQALGETTHMIALDLPGHGRSPGPGCRRIADYSQILVAALDALGLEQAVLAGHSMGGAIALWTALTAPERVAGLALIGTGARLRVLPALIEGFVDDPAAAVRLIVARAYSNAAAPELRAAGEAAFRQTDPAVFHEDLLGCHVFDALEQVQAIRCPTLLLCGTEDQLTPPRFSEYLHEQIAGSTLVLVPGAGHMVLIEQPEAVNAALREFFYRLTCQYRSD